ncbi:hypothetical protein DS745_22985 [Anaerobacillus alkaliphilus]|uniref:Lipoprotein n=1 Tax=Anaerobacillus alkaliphilus TaxID=1548597 RepID=A0A4Q0VNZ1_9BACI|nr:hypothetical protein [Anaerobacillus alkaliphilus]RXI96572.1 hypothetical protein DS745_22985 [Anaerobacillus alkaliphilus]
MNLKNIYIVGFIALFLTACGNHSTSSSPEVKETASTPGTEAAAFVPPEVAEISFKLLELDELVEGEPLETWEYIKSVPLGRLIEKDITLHVYKDTDPNSLCHYATVSLLDYDNNTYKFNDCTSEGLLQEDADGLYVIDILFESQEKKQIVHSSFELLANGPGRMQYIVFDVSEEKFFTFEDWGTPFTADLDETLLVIQFPGLHMDWPDVTIVRWQNGQLEKSQSIKEVLGLGNQQDYVQYDEDKSLFIAYVVVDEFSEEYSEVKYTFEEGNLIKD